MAVMRFAGDALRNRFGAVVTLRGSGLVGAAGLLIAALAPDVPVAHGGLRAGGAGGGQHGADLVLGRRKLSRFRRRGRRFRP
jgi:hypothetical protein